MADASRVGYRTNGLSSALQLHHLSSRVGQTDGIAPPGVHQPRKPMDHAIADSHATVTISHMTIRSHQTPQSVQSDGALPGLLVLFWHEEGQEMQEPRNVRSITLDSTCPVPAANDRIVACVPCRGDLRKHGPHSGARTKPQKGRYVKRQFAERRSLPARQRSPSRAYAAPAAAPSPCRSASMPSATSAAEWSSSSSPAGRVCTRPP